MGFDRSSAPSNRYGWLLVVSFHSRESYGAYEAFLSSMAMFIKLTCWVPPLLKAAKFYISALVSIGRLILFIPLSKCLPSQQWLIKKGDGLTLIVMRLHRRHFNSQDLLRFGRHLLDHILL